MQRLIAGRFQLVDLREHFIEAARGTIAEEARLDIETTAELHELTLESIDVEDENEKRLG